MAVIVTNGNTNLSTTNGFYRAEASNLSPFSTTFLSLSSARTIAVTFANAGNCQGVILGLKAVSAGISAFKNVFVELQELVAAVWTTRASVTVNGDSGILQSYTGITSVATNLYYVPFTGGTFPYAVDTTAGKWRFQISDTSTGGEWSLATSDATNPFYVTWCDTAVTFASNDVPICKDQLTIDATATFKGVLGTGDATNSVCCVVCRNSSDPTDANIANLLWANPPAASYTLTIDGWCLVSARGGVRFGTSAARIPTAQKAILSVIAATSGTATNSGFNANVSSLTYGQAKFFFYGEIPAVEDALLASDAATGQANFTTTVATDWANGDLVYVGGENVAGAGEGTIYTVSSRSGATVTLTSNLLTNTRKAQGRVIKLTGYGVELLGSGAVIQHQLGSPSSLVVSGVRVKGCVFLTSTQPAARDPVALLSQHVYEHSSGEGTSSVANGGVQMATYYPNGAKVDHVNRCKGQLGAPGGSSSGNVWGPVTFTNNIVLSQTFYTSGGTSFQFFDKQTITDNAWENTSSSCVTVNGFGAFSFRRNWFFGSSAQGVTLGTIFDVSDWGDNIYNKITGNSAIFFSSSRVINLTMKGEVFGNVQVNTVDFANCTGVSYLRNLILDSPVSSSLIATVTPNGAQPAGLLEGSWYAITNFNQVANDDRMYQAGGLMQRTGYGLTDTTVWTGSTFGAAVAGQFGLRLAPVNLVVVSSALSAMYSLIYQCDDGTMIGNCQNRAVTVSVRVKINNAAFYAGTHTKPTLRVSYDYSTVVTTVAAGSTADQQLTVTFTPATTIPYITIQVLCATDATGTNAYVYLGEIVVSNFTGMSKPMDIWAGQPLWMSAPPMPLGRRDIVRRASRRRRR